MVTLESPMRMVMPSPASVISVALDAPGDADTSRLRIAVLRPWLRSGIERSMP